MYDAENIREGAEKVRRQAGLVSARIMAFEAFLKDLPGRVETMIGNKETLLIFMRDGRQWAVFYAMMSDPQPRQWRKLTEGALKIKMQALVMFPMFFDAMKKSQDMLVNNLQATMRTFDTWCEANNIKLDIKEEE